jgi:hypothetical protein
MRSKFSIKVFESIFAGILLLLVLSLTLLAVVMTPSIAYTVKAGTVIVSLIILIAFIRSAKSNWNKVRIDKDALYISPFFGLWTNKITWHRVSGIERAIQRGEDTDIKLLYIYIDHVKKVRISSDHYRNMYQVYRSLSAKTKVSGSEFVALRREPEKPVSKLWTALAMGIPCIVMMGACAYTLIEQRWLLSLIYGAVGLSLGIGTIWIVRRKE